jgi:hypothetical protein
LRELLVNIIILDHQYFKVRNWIKELMRRQYVALAAACVAFTFVYVITATLIRNEFLNDPDTFLHIGVGNWILQNHRLPTADQFSYTTFGKPWFAADWISDLVFAFLYRAGQWRAVTEIVAVTCALISGVLSFYLARKLRLSVALGLTAIIVALISPHFLARPVIFSYLLLSIWIVLILEIEDRAEWAASQGFILIPIMLLWANVHGGFTFGLLVFYLFLGNAFYDAYSKRDLRKLRRLLALFAGVTVAALATPNGPLSTLRTAQLMNVPTLGNIDEWHAPDFQNDKFHLISIVGVFALLAYFGIRLRGPRLLTLLLISVLALEHRRGLGLFALIAPLLIVRPLSECVPWLAIQDHVLDPVSSFASKRSGAIALVCTVLVIATGVTRWTMPSRIEPPAGFAPEKAISAARLASLNDNVFNSYEFGGYLIFKGIPTFVDGRIELYGNQFLQRYFASMALTNPEEATQFLNQYDVHWALLRPGEPIAFMLKVDGWVQLYGDDSAIILVKSP